MEIKSTPQFIGLDVVIKHDKPFIAPVLLWTFIDLERAVSDASRKQIEEIAETYPDLSNEFLGFALDALERNRYRLVWLEGVEPGSNKFKGSLAGVVGWLALLFATNVTGDVLEKKEWYGELVEQLDKSTDRLGELIVDDLRRTFHPQGLPDGVKIDAQIVGGSRTPGCLSEPRTNGPRVL
ncbi:hypothetical protein [Methyloceanibacter methanicus]|uniref:hypothetical protein n=1 Tax=Methyloceanibacter methanicus TaxID=1774968 RepID=UPI00114D0855|nr:hypothetical protein [Methyloceanibacter methanicus]